MKSSFTATIHAFFREKIFKPIKADWSAFSSNPQVLKPCRFPILMVLIVSITLVFVSQGQDLLLGLAEHFSNKGYGCGPVIFLILGTLVWAIYSWYWSRVMLYMYFKDIPGDDPQLRNLRNHIPRVIGFMALLMIGVAFVKALWDYWNFLEEEMRWILGLLGLVFFVMALLFMLITTKRRDWMNSARMRLKKISAPAPLIKLFTVPLGPDVKYGIRTIKDLPPAARVAILTSFAITICFFIIFVSALQQAAPVIGAAAIVLFAAAGWITVGSLIDYAGLRFSVPALSILLALVILFSFFNDNHAIRTMARSCKVKRLALADALNKWYDEQKKQPLPLPEQRYPFFIVAAEGGGIRAAYWTASVLDTIQHNNPGFANRLFAISSVSGGSLGSAVFLAQLSTVPADAAGIRHEHVVRTAEPSLPPERLVQDVLGEDFLAPVVGGMLLPDLLQWIIPFPVECFDRARALEGAWEQSWEKHTGNNLFSREFCSLWKNQGDAWSPALFLNSTWVETGKRIIISNVLIKPEDFADTEDLIALYEQESFKPENRSFPLSTAVHLSARFPYISPAGTLTDGTTVFGRAVDGGYFENSGETTVLEVLKTLDNQPWRNKVQPIVIHITNEPVDPHYDEVALSLPVKDKKTRPKSCMNEFLTPIRSLLNTRDARAVYAWKTVRWHVGESNFIRFRLCKDKKLNLPLGWVLSKAVQDEIRRQLGCKCVYYNKEEKSKTIIFDNAIDFQHISGILKQGYVLVPVGE